MVRPLLVAVVAVVALTACDDSSRHGHAGRRPYTNQEVRAAFAAAGIHLAPGLMARGVVPGLRAIFDGEGGVEVAVFRTVRSTRVLGTGWSGASPARSQRSRNVVVLYPTHTRVLRKIRRALVRLRRL